ncbi:hypothetical protein EMEDMD4_1310073 [Sinorhizobium medicae]|uniref:Uncharacterized protein n=1 Tax=Sinorhizobium medicae TaxID=110321 RepID=A0A508WWL9_9HYPH|nr:hypothetical protein EMEDMD4_1310073 [Sinorhizobium medicae]
MDAATAAVLFALLGFRWSLLSVLVVEAVPGLQLFRPGSWLCSLWQHGDLLLASNSPSDVDVPIVAASR